ncbi:hypothetical protein BZA05DRAFT_212320 [Tricharina praecox]|uniref:uncharacterized protein n=1 Tax=Tricharina praecox TaxID=43433 RepID=UPI00221FCFAC|nr:uncharacterized protein BZA05DRAFT_212320 [Tricharina praecox]KAI5841587.1 hypothetical protein BZA05DRAFT_212320 [Tricharina praecox]
MRGASGCRRLHMTQHRHEREHCRGNCPAALCTRYVPIPASPGVHSGAEQRTSHHSTSQYSTVPYGWYSSYPYIPGEHGQGGRAGILLLLLSSTPPLLLSSSPPLLLSSTPLLLHSSSPPLLHSSSPPLLFSSTPPLLHSSTPPLLLSSSCTAAHVEWSHHRTKESAATSSED